MNWTMIEKKWSEMAQRLQGAKSADTKNDKRDTLQSPDRTGVPESSDNSAMA